MNYNSLDEVYYDFLCEVYDEHLDKDEADDMERIGFINSETEQRWLFKMYDEGLTSRDSCDLFVRAFNIYKNKLG